MKRSHLLFSYSYLGAWSSELNSKICRHFSKHTREGRSAPSPSRDGTGRQPPQRLSHSMGAAGHRDITRAEQGPEESGRARPPGEEIKTGKGQEGDLRESSTAHGCAASQALAQVPAAQGEQLPSWTFSSNFHNSLLFRGAAEQCLPFSSAPWGSFPDPNFHAENTRP